MIHYLYSKKVFIAVISIIGIAALWVWHSSREQKCTGSESPEPVQLPSDFSDMTITKSDDGNYIPDWYFTTDGLGWDWVMSFDSKTNTLYIPEGGNMEMSDRYDLYRYEDGRMVYVGNDAGYWLHPSLKNFKRLAGIYQTETKLIRVDILQDDTFRYAAWPKSKPMSSKPELVMTGGKGGIIKNAIVFKNGDYTYIVPKYRRGQGDDFGKVIIKYKNKVIQESEV